MDNNTAAPAAAGTTTTVEGAKVEVQTGTDKVTLVAPKRSLTTLIASFGLGTLVGAGGLFAWNRWGSSAV